MSGHQSFTVGRQSNVAITVGIVGDSPEICFRVQNESDLRIVCAGHEPALIDDQKAAPVGRPNDVKNTFVRISLENLHFVTGKLEHIDFAQGVIWPRKSACNALPIWGPRDVGKNVRERTDVQNLFIGSIRSGRQKTIFIRFRIFPTGIGHT